MGSAWHVADSPYVKNFARKHIPNRPPVPSADVLSGRVLDKTFVEITGGWKEKTRGRFASAQSDGWKNVARRHLLATVMIVCGIVCSHLSPAIFPSHLIIRDT
jgi:hypothetical protein